jgi:hypothetical protein
MSQPIYSKSKMLLISGVIAIVIVLVASLFFGLKFIGDLNNQAKKRPTQTVDNTPKSLFNLSYKENTTGPEIKMENSRTDYQGKYETYSIVIPASGNEQANRADIKINSHQKPQNQTGYQDNSIIIAKNKQQLTNDGFYLVQPDLAIGYNVAIRGEQNGIEYFNRYLPICQDKVDSSKESLDFTMDLQNNSQLNQISQIIANLKCS